MARLGTGGRRSPPSGLRLPARRGVARGGRGAVRACRRASARPAARRQSPPKPSKRSVQPPRGASRCCGGALCRPGGGSAAPRPPRSPPRGIRCPRGARGSPHTEAGRPSARQRAWATNSTRAESWGGGRPASRAGVGRGVRRRSGRRGRGGAPFATRDTRRRGALLPPRGARLRPEGLSRPAQASKQLARSHALASLASPPRARAAPLAPLSPRHLSLHETNPSCCAAS